MPEPTGTYNDGGIKFVRQTISAVDISGANKTYIVKSGSIKAGTKRIVQEDENGNENKQGFMTQIRSGSLTCSFTASADKEPKRLQVITCNDESGGAVNLIIAEVDQNFGSDIEATFTLTVYEQQAQTTEAG